MKKKFKKGDVVTTNTHAVYEHTQESLSGLKGEIVNTKDYPYNIHVKVQLKKAGTQIIGYSEFELQKTN
jgi:hypothetical protein